MGERRAVTGRDQRSARAKRARAIGGALVMAVRHTDRYAVVCLTGGEVGGIEWGTSNEW
jgi:hypothetical protein